MLAACENNLVSSKHDDDTSGSMSTTPMSGKVDFCSEKVKTNKGKLRGVARDRKGPLAVNQ